ncbi:duf395 domain containing protein [Grosmannia clavigera kw1407]|uniref:Duf395 domain containing protein n=1 Tax=Grosmannia clavigera (strain kw1407 / UAMH 11150) TaxID=655863 RepID=F0XFM2_GROCL|nr:duf395 domain containing protein [Grosmannia clavigera kw1407]EFX04533.1 duf395 domain containing protein [Grosmannia clavigera kw1407]
MAATIITGAAFGAALTASGVDQPAVILGQLKWENYHMLQAFLTATAASALVNSAANTVGHASLKPRQYATRGWFAPFDGNIVGGLILGVGMALSGSCPGTVLSQSALNIRSGYFALAGGFVGGAVWAVILRPRLARKLKERVERKKKTATAAGTASVSEEGLPISVPALLGVSTGVTLAVYEALLATVVGGTAVVYGPGSYATLSPVVGGLLIGLAQLISVAVRKTTLGVSAVYEDFGDWLKWATSGDSTKKPAVNSFLFALGIAAGSRTTVTLFPALVAHNATSSASLSISPSAAVMGGFAMALGSRIAGGCTSGHGISGMSLMSLPSFITIGSAFLGGGIAALLL